MYTLGFLLTAKCLTPLSLNPAVRYSKGLYFGKHRKFEMLNSDSIVLMLIIHVEQVI
jgi:hypothetical protein